MIANLEGNCFCEAAAFFQTVFPNQSLTQQLLNFNFVLLLLSVFEVSCPNTL